MGQNEKARAVVESAYEFRSTSAKTPEVVSAAALAAAEQSGGRLRGTVVNVGGHKDDDGTLTSFFVVKGPGGFVDIMDFAVTAKPHDGKTTVSLDVGNFTFQKGSLGMKPTINGKVLIAKYVVLLQAALQ